MMKKIQELSQEELFAARAKQLKLIQLAIKNKQQIELCSRERPAYIVLENLNTVILAKLSTSIQLNNNLSICIQDTIFDYQGLECLAAIISKITDLRLYNCNIDGSISTLPKGTNISSRLKILDIKSLNEQPFRLIRWFSYFLQHNEQLIELSVGLGFIKNHPVDKFTLNILCAPNLQKMELAYATISESNAKFIKKVLSDNEELIELKLYYVKFDLGSISLIAEGLKKSKSIQKLDMTLCYLEHKYVEVIADVITKSQSLKNIDLSYSGVEDAGALCILSAIKLNPNIIHVELTHDHVSTEIVEQITDALKDNAAIKFSQPTCVIDEDNLAKHSNLHKVLKDKSKYAEGIEKYSKVEDQRMIISNHKLKLL